MTVNKLLEELARLSDEGYGDVRVYSYDREAGNVEVSQVDAIGPGVPAPMVLLSGE
jgi:hypothetical protein